MMRAREGTPYNQASSRFLTRAAWVAMPAFFFLNTQISAAAAQYKSFQTHSHLQIPLDPKMDSSIEKIEEAGKLIGLRVKVSNALSSEASISQLEKFQDDRTGKVQVSKVTGAEGDDYSIEIYFSSSAKAQGVEYFDFKAKSPYSFQLDYWLKESLAEQKTATQTEKVIQKKASVKPNLAKLSLKNAASKAPSRSGCFYPLNKETDALAYFKIWHVYHDYSSFFALETPDAKYAYPAAKPEKGESYGARAKEVAHYRLALKLYKSNQLALTLRTMDFFEKSYPRSPFMSEFEFLKANIYLKLGRQLKSNRYEEMAQEVFRKIILESPNSSKGIQSLSYMVQEQMKAAQPIKALEYALMGSDSEMIKKELPQSNKIFRMAAAEALYSMGEFDRAERFFQSLIDEGGALSDEAAFKLSDVYAARKFFERAAIGYELAIRKRATASMQYPMAWFNLAESYFKLNRYADAEKTFQDFLKHFPSSKYAWAARLRIAEMAHLNFADKSGEGRKIGKLYEDVVNLHPYTPGNLIAQTRLALCDFENAESKTAFFSRLYENRDLKGAEDALLEAFDVELMLDLSEARYYSQNSDEEMALKKVEAYRNRYSRLPIAPSFQKEFKKSLLGLVIKTAKTEGAKELPQNTAKKILALNKDYVEFTPVPATFGYLMALSKAHFALGSLAEVGSNLPQLHATLAQASDTEKDDFHFLNARFLKLTGAPIDAVLAELSQIRGDANGNGPLSAIKYEQLAQTAALKEKGKGGVQESAAYGEVLLQNDLFKKLPMDRQIAVHVQYLENLKFLGKKEEVVKVADRALIRFGIHAESKKELLRIKELRAQALYGLGEDKKALVAIGEILDQDPQNKRSEEFEFSRAKILARIGRETEAIETFKKLSQTASNDVWKKSAQDELDQLQWENSQNKQSN